MKTIYSTILRSVSLALVLVLFVNISGFATIGITQPSGVVSVTEAPDPAHSIRITTSLSNKQHKVRLFPDAHQKVLFFTVNGQDGKVYQLHVFDMDGNEVSAVQIHNRQVTVLTNLTEGNYLYQVFIDDEQIENGQVTVR
jgi:hypothetical protein